MVAPSPLPRNQRGAAGRRPFKGPSLRRPTAGTRRSARAVGVVIRDQDSEDGILLIDGIQGIGKTGLLREFARQAVADERHRPAAIVHLPLVADELSARPADLAAALLGGIPSAMPALTGARREVGRAFAWIRRTVKRGPGFELRVQEDLPLNQLLRESLAMGWWDGHALLLTIDEIQNIDGDGRRNLATLHEGKHGCPILAVCAGLQHSRQVLQEPMTTSAGMPSPTISRCSRLNLSMLSRQEAIEAARMSVRKARNQPMPEELARRIAEASLGFPQHVHGYVQACVDACDRFGALGAVEAGSGRWRKATRRAAATMKGACNPSAPTKASSSPGSPRWRATTTAASPGTRRRGSPARRTSTPLVVGCSPRPSRRAFSASSRVRRSWPSPFPGRWNTWPSGLKRRRRSKTPGGRRGGRLVRRPRYHGAVETPIAAHERRQARVLRS